MKLQVKLVPMTEEAFRRYMETAVEEYTQTRIQSGDEPTFARRRAEEDYEKLLPEGLHSKGQHVYSIVPEGAGEPVGMVWFAMPGREGPHSAYVYDFKIDEAHRRKGYAAAALREVDVLAASMGATRISLNVMGHNVGAQALYRQAGFQVVGIGMTKMLEAPER